MDAAPFPLNGFDYVLLGVLLFCMVRGLVRGLSGELAQAVTTVLVVGTGILAFRPLGAWLSANSRLEGGPAYALAFALVLVAAYLAVLLVRLLMRQVLEWSFKGGFQRLGGLLAGLVRGFLNIAVLVLACSLLQQETLTRYTVEDSWIGARLNRVLLPLYRDLAEDHPEWQLPLPDRPDAESPPDDPGTG